MGGCASRYQKNALQGRGEKDDYCPWQSSSLLWHLGSIPPQDVPGVNLTRQEIVSIFTDAFAEWERNCDLSTSKTSQRATAAIKINFVSKAEKPNEFPQIGDRARAYPPCPKGRKKGKVYFLIDSENIWNESELYKFAVHEFGHALGMNFHSGDSLDVMYEDPSIWNDYLTTNDISHIRALYPEEETNDPSFV